MKKRLTEEQFQKTVDDLNISDQTKEIAFGVLVKDKSQVSYVNTLGLSKGAVWQAVKRVWDHFEKNNTPEGYEKVCVILPEHQAYIVKNWAKKTKDKLDL
jgi:hypothetical protein